MKKELLLFCSSNYTNVNNDLLINKYKLFDKVNLLNENDLDDYIKGIINNIIDKYGIRGYGYWIWKPYIILQELNKLNNGDILVHLDCHCKLDKIKNNFESIVNQLNKDKLIIAINGTNDLSHTTTKLKEAVEDEMNYKFSLEELGSFQYEAGILFIKKCDFTINFFTKYLDIMMNHIDVITDIYNNDESNYKDFIENRHDQSVCSLLAKYYKVNNFNITWELLH